MDALCFFFFFNVFVTDLGLFLPNHQCSGRWIGEIKFPFYRWGNRDLLSPSAGKELMWNDSSGFCLLFSWDYSEGSCSTTTPEKNGPKSIKNACKRSSCKSHFIDRNTEAQDFRGGPVVKTLLFQSRGPGFDPWAGDQNPHAATKSSNTTTKTWCSKIDI